MPQSRSTPARSRSRVLPGPPHLRYYPAERIVAWRPQGVLNDQLLDDIAQWICAIENVSLPFNRVVDLSDLTRISLRIQHVFTFARKRANDSRGLKPVRCALFCDKVVGFGIARLYETLMANTTILARAFQERAAAAEWLGVPEEILALADQPSPSP
jgi:hypothetical protein